MKALLLIFLLVSAFAFNLKKSKKKNKVNYDSYVMAVQWSNGYCKINNCGKTADHVYKNTFTIHGLWPSLKSGKRLPQCTNGVIIEDDGSDLFKDMKQYWPSFKVSGTNEEFWEHEYNKHGYCMIEEYGWDGYEDYFDFVINEIFLKTYKNLIMDAFPGKSATTISVKYAAMIDAIQEVIPNATFKMICKNKYIYEFYFYLEKDFEPSTDSRFSNSCSNGQLIFK